MNEEQFEDMRATFPWTKRVVVVNGVGGIVQMVDRNGTEVPLFAMTDFVEMITRKLSEKNSAT